VVEKDGVLDRMTIKVEITPEMFADDTRVINALRERIRDELTALITIRPLVEIKQPGSLPVAEGKAKRVEDLRNS
jgi:phenylacetate-CoA ligase